MNLPWIDSPFFYQELEQSTLDSTTKEQVKHYAEKGYLIVDTELPESTFDRIVELLKPHYTSPRLQDAWNITPLVKDIAGCRKVLDMLRVLYRREPFPFKPLTSVWDLSRKHIVMLSISILFRSGLCAESGWH